MPLSRFPYRTVVLATLVWLAVGFALTQGNDPGGEQNKATAAPKAPEVGAPETFGSKLLSDPTAFFTMALAGLTAVLAATAAGQIFYLRRADETARRSADAALKAAGAAERSAGLAEAALIGAEAPFIFAVAEAWTKSDPEAPGGMPGFGSYTLHNYGRSPAIIREVYSGALGQGVPAAIGFPPPQSNLRKVEVLPPGKATEPHRFGIGAFLMPDMAPETVPNTGGMGFPLIAGWIIGQVRYSDAYGTQYLTGFCFAFNPGSQRFYAQGGTAYNYRRRLNEAETRIAEERDATMPAFLTPRTERT